MTIDRSVDVLTEEQIRRRARNVHRNYGRSYGLRRPSAMEGAARLLDFANTLSARRVADPGFDTDCVALRSDWAAVGGSLWMAILKAHPEIADE